MAEGTRHHSMTKLYDKEEVNKAIFAALFVVVPLEQEVNIEAPVVTLQGEAANVYPVIEKHLSPDYNIGTERFWRLVKTSAAPEIMAWRPRVHGVQLKALKCRRLPESAAEWAQMMAAALSIAGALRGGPNAASALTTDLMQHATWVRQWWLARNTKPGGGMVKRASSTGLLSGGSSSSRRQAASFPAHEPTRTSSAADKKQKLHGSGRAAGIKLESRSGGLSNGLVREESGSPSRPHSSLRASGLSLAFRGVLQEAAMDEAHVCLNLLNSQQQPEGGALASTVSIGGALERHDVVPAAPPASKQLVIKQIEQPMHKSHAVEQSLEPQPELLQLERPTAVQTPGTQPPQPATASASPSPSPAPAQAVKGERQRSSQLLALDLEQRIMTLNVGGQRFVTTAATLAAVEQSFLWKLVFMNQAGSSPGGQSGEFFIDRTNRVFEHVIEYLRSLRFSDAELPMPAERKDLALLLREANFYGLPELSAKAEAALAGCKEEAAPLQLHVRVDNMGAVSVHHITLG